MAITPGAVWESAFLKFTKKSWRRSYRPSYFWRIVVLTRERSSQNPKGPDMARSKTCEDCTTRPATEEINGELKYCSACLRLEEDGNHHSDAGHEYLLATADADLTLKDWNFRTKKALMTWVDSERKVMETCWVCHPELDETKVEYTPRRGTSRLGMVINVPQRAPGQEKAAVLLARITNGATQFSDTDVKIATKKGVTTLKVADFTCAWDEQGRWTYGGTSYTDDNGRARRIRNAAEFLRLVGAGASTK